MTLPQLRPPKVVAGSQAKPTPTSTSTFSGSSGGRLPPLRTTTTAPAPAAKPSSFKTAATAVAKKVGDWATGPSYNDRRLQKIKEDLAAKEARAREAKNNVLADKYAKRLAVVVKVSRPEASQADKNAVLQVEEVRRQAQLPVASIKAASDFYLGTARVIAERLQAKAGVTEESINKPKMDTSALPTSLLEKGKVAPPKPITPSPLAEVNKNQQPTKKSLKSDIFTVQSDAIRKFADEVNPTNPNFADSVSQGFGSMAGYGVMSALVGGGSTSMAAVEALSESAAVYEELRNSGMSVEEASTRFDRTFVANLIINYVTNKWSGLFEGGKKKIIEKVGEVSSEALQEGLQQITSNLATNKPTLDGVLESMAVGAIVSGGMVLFQPGGETEKITKGKENPDGDNFALPGEPPGPPGGAAGVAIAPEAPSKLPPGVYDAQEIINAIVNTPQADTASGRKLLAEAAQALKTGEQITIGETAKVEPKVAEQVPLTVEDVKAQEVKKPTQTKVSKEVTFPKDANGERLSLKDVTNTKPENNLQSFIAEKLKATMYKANPKYGVTTSKSQYFATEDGNTIQTNAKESDSKISVQYVQAGNEGKGIGTKYLEALKAYADKTGKQIVIGDIASPKFFDKFKWLQKGKGGLSATYTPKKKLGAKKVAVSPKTTPQKATTAPKPEVKVSKEAAPAALVKKIQKLVQAGNTEVIDKLRASFKEKPNMLEVLEDAVVKAEKKTQSKIEKIDREENPELQRRAKESARVIKKAQQRDLTQQEFQENAHELYKRLLLEEKIAKRVTDEEVATILRKYFNDNELMVRFVENIKTIDGGEAWAKYSQGIIDFVHNPKGTVPTHEALHAFLDLFVSGEQKSAYLSDITEKLQSEMGEAKYNKEVRLIQEQNSNENGVGPTFKEAGRIYAEEWLADDFVNYVQNRESKTFLQKFYDRILRVIRNFTDPNDSVNLYEDIIAKRRSGQTKANKERAEYFAMLTNEFKATTKALERIRSQFKGEITSKQEILNILGQPGISTTDKSLLTGVLKNFPNKGINIVRFLKEAQEQVMEISITSVNKWTDYGFSHVTSSIFDSNDTTDRESLAPSLVREEIEQATDLIETPFKHGQFASIHWDNPFSNTKFGYQVRKGTFSDTGLSYWFVVKVGERTGDYSYEENIKGVENTLEEANILARLLDKNEPITTGIIGHARMWTTRTIASITDTYNKTVENYQTTLENDKKALTESASKKEEAAKVAKKVTARLNKAFKKILKTPYLDSGKTIAKYAGNTGRYLENYFYYYWKASLTDAQRETTSLDEYAVQFIKELFEGTGKYRKSFYRSFMNDAHFTDYEDQTFNEDHITRVILEYSDADTRSVESINDNITYLTTRIKEVKKALDEAVTNFKEGPINRWLIEVQSDPFQTSYRLQTEYMDAKAKVGTIDQERWNYLENLKESAVMRDDDLSASEREKLILRDKLNAEYWVGKEKEREAITSRQREYWKNHKEKLDEIMANNETYFREAKKKFVDAQEKVQEIYSKLPLLQKQFYTVGADVHTRIMKEEIRKFAIENIDAVRAGKEVYLNFPTDLTEAHIQGYPPRGRVKNGEFITSERTSEPPEIVELREKYKEKAPVAPTRPDEPDLRDMSGYSLVLYKPKGSLLAKMKDLQHRLHVFNKDTGQFFKVDYIAIGGPNGDYSYNFVGLGKERSVQFSKYDGKTSRFSVEYGQKIKWDGKTYTVVNPNNDDNTISVVGRGAKYKKVSFKNVLKKEIARRIEVLNKDMESLILKRGEINNYRTAEAAYYSGDYHGESYNPISKILAEMMRVEPRDTILDWKDYRKSGEQYIKEVVPENIMESSHWERLGFGGVKFVGTSRREGTFTYLLPGSESIKLPDPSSYGLVFDSVSLSQAQIDKLSIKPKSLGRMEATYEKNLNRWRKQRKAWEKKMEQEAIQFELDKKAILQAIRDNPNTRKNVNKFGEYIFEISSVTSENGRTVVSQYRNKYVPLFRELRAGNLELVVDKNGFQWWRTKITTDDIGAVVAFQRKTKEEIILQKLDELLAQYGSVPEALKEGETPEEVVVTNKRAAAQRPVSITSDKQASTAFSRIVGNLENEKGIDVEYDRMSIILDAANAMDFVEQHPERALRIAKGLELPPQDITDTAISSAVAESVRRNGDTDLWKTLVAARSLRQTRRGQEIVAERGRVTENSPEYYLELVMKQMQEVAMSQKTWIYPTKGKKKVSFNKGLALEVEKAVKIVNNKVNNSLENAQKVLDQLTCK